MGMVMYLRRATIEQMDALRSAPDTVADCVFDNECPASDLIEFYKAWHALHFLLTGDVYDTASPLGIIAGQAEDVGNDEGGFWIVTPEKMRAFDDALRALDDDTLKQRYDLRQMIENDIYIADALEGDDESIDYIVQGVPALRRFAITCAESGDGAIRLMA